MSNERRKSWKRAAIVITITLIAVAAVITAVVVSRTAQQRAAYRARTEFTIENVAGTWIDYGPPRWQVEISSSGTMRIRADASGNSRFDDNETLGEIEVRIQSGSQFSGFDGTIQRPTGEILFHGNIVSRSRLHLLHVDENTNRTEFWMNRLE
jgi:hypothetical protein